MCTLRIAPQTTKIEGQSQAGDGRSPSSGAILGSGADKEVVRSPTDQQVEPTPEFCHVGAISNAVSASQPRTAQFTEVTTAYFDFAIRFKDTHRQESAEGPYNRWSICQEEFLEAYCAVRFVEQVKPWREPACKPTFGCPSLVS